MLHRLMNKGGLHSSEMQTAQASGEGVMGVEVDEEVVVGLEAGAAGVGHQGVEVGEVVAGVKRDQMREA